jgi:hypothetical protein
MPDEPLSRHIQRESDGSLTLNGTPRVKPDEAAETLEHACGALLGVCTGANQMIGGTPSGKLLSELCDELVALRKQQYGA